MAGLIDPSDGIPIQPSETDRALAAGIAAQIALMDLIDTLQKASLIDAKALAEKLKATAELIGNKDVFAKLIQEELGAMIESVKTAE